MNIGPLAIPIEPLILLGAIAVAVLTCRLFSTSRKETESAIFLSVFVGLAVARLSFVLHYLPSYHSLFQMLDFRDEGFDAVPGLVAGIAVVLFLIIRRASLRRPLAAAVTAGLLFGVIADVTVKSFPVTTLVPSLSLADETGTLRRLDSHDGKPLVVNLWATWCGPCRAEMPVLAAEQRAHGEFNLVFVNQGESAATIDAFLTELGLHIDNLRLDPNLTLAKATGTTAYPTTLFYDASGHLLEKHLGRFSQATFDATLARLYPSVDHAK